jgi:hypothetical protein
MSLSWASVLIIAGSKITISCISHSGDFIFITCIQDFRYLSAIVGFGATQCGVM